MLLSIVGKYEHHTELDYRPNTYNAVTCMDSHIVVAQYASPPILHIHSWHGDHLVSMDLKHRGLGEKYWVHCVAASDGGVVHVTAGPNHYSVTSLLALQVHITALPPC